MRTNFARSCGPSDITSVRKEAIASFEREGNAIGGLSVGEPAEEMYAMTELVCNILPEEKPRYLMGVGTPVNILENIALGVDMFDCVMPTRNSRHGLLFTRNGILNMRNEKWKNDFIVTIIIISLIINFNIVTHKKITSHLHVDNLLL